MELNINYIYDSGGQREYAVVPIRVWETLQTHLQTIENELVKPFFDPLNFWACLSLGNIDLEHEFLQLRQEWNRDF